MSDDMPKPKIVTREYLARDEFIILPSGVEFREEYDTSHFAEVMERCGPPQSSPIWTKDELDAIAERAKKRTQE